MMNVRCTMLCLRVEELMIRIVILEDRMIGVMHGVTNMAHMMHRGIIRHDIQKYCITRKSQ